MSNPSIGDRLLRRVRDSHQELMITTRLGLSVAAGVPVLVLVSMGPVAAMAGTASMAVWTASAVIGFFMALAFAELMSSFPSQAGGIGVLAACVLAPRSRALARLSGWSYWFGWSPALAINGLLVGNYLHDELMLSAPPWTAAVVAAAVLVLSATVNHRGLPPGARVQFGLAACVVIATAVLVGGAVLRGGFAVRRLAPFTPPGGWLSGQGFVAVSGALFIAGWSAYGSELALSYGTEYRGGTRDALDALALVAVCSVAAYGLVPLVLLGVVGVTRIQDDPARALTPLLQQAAGGASGIVVGMLVLALLLGLNMVTIGSSRTLCHMARRGDAWTWLGRLNGHGVPGNAVRFDLVFNVLLLFAVTALNHGQTAAVPIALLAASNVGYMVSICLALAAAWLNHRRPPSAACTLRVRDGLMRLCPALVAINAALLVGAGYAWGWSNVGLGLILLAAVTVVGPSGLAGCRPAPGRP
jgi:amino acid transporter